MCDTFRCDPHGRLCRLLCHLLSRYRIRVFGYGPFPTGNPARGSLGYALITLRYASAVAKSPQR